MMAFITLSCNHHFVTYITYKSFTEVIPKKSDLRSNSSKKGRPSLGEIALLLALQPL
jgi:hypothetical protein